MCPSQSPVWGWFVRGSGISHGRFRRSVMNVALFMGQARGLWLVYLPSCTLPIVDASFLEYRSIIELGGTLVPICFGQVGSFSVSRYLLHSSYRGRPVWAEWRHYSSRHVSVSWVECAHNVVIMASSRQKTPGGSSWPWEVCTRTLEKLAGCPETSAFSVANVDKFWEFSLDCRLAILTASHYRVGYYIKCLWVGAFETTLWRNSVWQRRGVYYYGRGLPGWGFNNDETSFTWRVLQSTLRFDKRIFSERLAISRESIRYGEIESIAYTFFNCPVVRPLCGHLEVFVVRILNGKFFVQEISSVCCYVVSLLNRKEHCISLFTWYYTSRDLDDVTEGVSRRQVLLISVPFY